MTTAFFCVYTCSVLFMSKGTLEAQGLVHVVPFASGVLELALDQRARLQGSLCPLGSLVHRARLRPVHVVVDFRHLLIRPADGHGRVRGLLEVCLGDSLAAVLAGPNPPLLAQLSQCLELVDGAASHKFGLNDDLVLLCN